MRKDGMRFETYMDVDRKNKILLQKMGRIMQGNYATSTTQVSHSIESKPASFNSLSVESKIA
jgi:hypothetical protein